jgi:hypothetical protein
MTRLVLLLCLFAGSLFSQAVWTPPVAPSVGVPAKLVLQDPVGTPGANTLICIVTGDAVPAVTLTFKCTFGGTVITSVPFTFQPNLTFNFGISIPSGPAVGGVFSMGPTITSGISAQSILHGGAAVNQGTF